jgi:hypothetical protein
MPGTNAGTGQPIVFKCSACRGWPVDVELTGRSKPVKTNKPGPRMTRTALEYRCACGHVGWSRHKSLARIKGD